MKRKLKSDRGFTLAELLIVVAIIGVLVAIAIPIFTSQLERSREAVDLSDVRSAYAEVMMAAITGDTSATYTKDSGQKIYKETDGTYSIMVTPLKQQKDGWQTPLPITIGGVSSSASEPYWVGAPGAGGSCKITYHPPTSTGDEYVSFYWTGGTDNGNNPALTPVPTSPPLLTLTPIPTQPGDNTENNITDNVQKLVNKYGVGTWPLEPSLGDNYKIHVPFGQIISYGKNYYVMADLKGGDYTFFKSQYYTSYTTPDSDPHKMLQITSVIYTPQNLNANNELDSVQMGNLYFTDKGDAYISKAHSSPRAVPPGDTSDIWVKIQSDQSTNWRINYN